jgi:ferritin-like metal-binding protein YciE
MAESAQETESGQSEDEQTKDSEERRSEESDERSDDQGDESEEQEEEKDPAEQLLLAHMKDSHALEEEGTKVLEGAIDLSKDDELEQLFKEQLEQTREHEDIVLQRLQAHDDDPEAIKDLQMQAAGSVGMRYLNEENPDTPVKLAMHLYCFQNLKVSAYEFLQRFADAAGDSDTAQAAQQMLENERGMIEKLRESFDGFVDLLGEYRGKEDEDEEGGEDGEGDDGQEEADEEDES